MFYVSVANNDQSHFERISHQMKRMKKKSCVWNFVATFFPQKIISIFPNQPRHVWLCVLRVPVVCLYYCLWIKHREHSNNHTIANIFFNWFLSLFVVVAAAERASCNYNRLSRIRKRTRQHYKTKQKSAIHVLIFIHYL